MITVGTLSILLRHEKIPCTGVRSPEVLSSNADGRRAEEASRTTNNELDRNRCIKCMGVL